jgi:prepilin-type N-terminal cleavage/methylation domain-containing protein
MKSVSRCIRAHRGSGRGFVLIETILAVAIFSIGVLALGRCVENCVLADIAKEQDNRARRALENEMALIESGAKPLAESSAEELKGMFQGMVLKTKRTLLKEKNEKNQDIVGIYDVLIEVGWTVGEEKQSRSIEFYYQPRQR